MKSVLFTKENGIATITLNRPESFNSFNRELALGLQAFLDVCALDNEIRVVVLTGNGRAFCAGQDLKEVSTPEYFQKLGQRRIFFSYFHFLGHPQGQVSLLGHLKTFVSVEY